jgi:hypothetical protein
VAVLTALAVGLIASASQAAPGDGTDPRNECMRAHVAYQELRNAGRLVEAGKQLRICVSSSCPGPVVADCAGWMNEMAQATPSLVFEVDADGHPASDAKVFVDNVPVSDWSKAVEVDPGNHAIRVELPPFAPHEETVTMAEGHRMRLLTVQFETPKPESQNQGQGPLPESPSRPGPVPVVTYPLIGVGVAGIAAGAIFEGFGRGQQTHLENTCSPHCTTNDLKSMKTDYLIGDISLGVGVAAAVAAAVVYFTRPSVKAVPPPVSFSVGPVGGVARSDSWGASATMRW